MLQKRVDAGVADQAEKMQISSAGKGPADRLVQFRVLVKFSAENLLGDGNGFLIDDASGADVLMADFAVAHGSVGQSHVESAGMNQRGGISAHDSIGDGMFCQEDGVGAIPFRIGIFSPTIADDDDTRTSLSARHAILSKMSATILLNVSEKKR